ncbi:MAG TPA: PP2C family serine/threonine-protein phosphatase, partial [Flavisolibacter sp.]|nr:PP2C family serine/threonine-protein phosphatase [Flavisolibacter sp.]
MAENFFGITDTGRQRNNNEDAFIAQSILNRQFIVACVIDGVGGYEGGEVAAAIARETILQALKKSPDNLLHTMQQAFASANEKIYQERVASGKNSSMACVATLAVVDIKNNKLSYVHVGDTRLYLFRDHSLIKITKDQSFVGFLEDSGRLPEQEAMKHPKRNEINKALGFDQPAGFYNDYIETGESPFLP